MSYSHSLILLAILVLSLIKSCHLHNISLQFLNHGFTIFMTQDIFVILLIKLLPAPVPDLSSQLSTLGHNIFCYFWLTTKLAFSTLPTPFSSLPLLVHQIHSWHVLVNNMLHLHLHAYSTINQYWEIHCILVTKAYTQLYLIAAKIKKLEQPNNEGTLIYYSIVHLYSDSLCFNMPTRVANHFKLIQLYLFILLLQTSEKNQPYYRLYCLGNKYDPFHPFRFWKRAVFLQCKWNHIRSSLLQLTVTTNFWDIFVVNHLCMSK